MMRQRWRGAMVLTGLVLVSLSPGVLAQNNTCESGEFPDVIVGDLHQTLRWGKVGSITGFSVGTVSCNVGTCWLDWEPFSNQHPVIAQNMFRLKDGRFEQIGQSWVKHGFNALSQQFCSTGCIPTTGDHLGVNCSDPYSSTLNGQQTRLGPKFEVNAAVGFHPHPVTDGSMSGDAIYKRLQVHDDDLDPLLNLEALYFVEGHYVALDDSTAGKQNNNASYRSVAVLGSSGTYDISLTGQTQRTQPAINAWPANEFGVDQDLVDVSGDGRFIVSAKATDLGGGVWNYEYAVHNLNSDRSGGSFTVPIPSGGSPSNIGFHDVDYHSGEPFGGTDWTAQVGSTDITWSTESFATNPDANALRWGTLYNFRFDLAAPPEIGEVTLGLFKTGSPADVSFFTLAPKLCDDDTVCEAGETCGNCPGDCPVSGADGDSDTFVSCQDCNDEDGTVWATPGEVRNLLVASGGVLTWDPPLSPGAGTITYETLRSGSPTDFITVMDCVPSVDPQMTTVTDTDLPATGEVFHYLVRAANGCPNPEGTIGAASWGTLRTGGTCE